MGFWTVPQAASCNFPSGQFDDGNDICDWGYRQEIIINAAQVTSSILNPVFRIDLSNMGTTFWNNVASDGGDIRITTSNGTTELARDIDSDMIDGATDKGFLYFRYSGTVSSVSNTSIYIYWGNASATNYGASATYGMNNTWQDFNGVYGAWENPSLGITDRTGNYGTLTNNGATQVSDSNYLNAINFDGNNDYISGGDRHDWGANDLWLHFDFNSDGDTGALAGLVGKTNNSSTDGRYATYIRYHNGLDDVLFAIDQGTGSPSASTAVVSPNTWYTTDGTLDRGGSLAIYWNGSLESSAAGVGTTNWNTTMPFIIGCYWNRGGYAERFFDGQFRGFIGLSYNLRVANDIDTLHNNETNNANFFNFAQSVETA